MKAHALISLANRVMDAPTQAAATEIAGNVGADYSDFIWKLVGKIHWKRTQKQNNFIHGWFAEIGKQTGEEEIEVKRRAKLDIGCIILCRDNPDFLENCKRTMGHLDREDRLKAMDWIRLTSVMSTKQLGEFADTFERIHRAEGYTLTMPKERAA